MLPLILGLSGPDLTPAERSLFKETQPAGFILFGRNVAHKTQLRALTDDLRTLTGRDDLPILIDQEGGRVARLGAPDWPAFPAQARFGALYRRAPISGMEAARVNALTLALLLREAGITVTTAPLLDLLHDGADPVIGDRALGAAPMQVAALGRMILDGLAEGGVAGVIKHMPGHGRALVDTHRALPIVTATAAEMESDLAPFRSLAGRAKIGMTAHIRYDCYDETAPATLSPLVIGAIIRDRIGFDGLLLSDDIGMAALSGPVAERAVAALAAGVDLVLHCSGDRGEAERLAAALPAIGAAAKARLGRAAPGAVADAGAVAAVPGLIEKRDALLALLD